MRLDKFSGRHAVLSALTVAAVGLGTPQTVRAQLFDPQPMTGDGLSRFQPKKPALADPDFVSQSQRSPAIQNAKPTPDDPSTPSLVKAAEPSQHATADGQSHRGGRSRLIGSGRASWYQHKGKTADGERYNPDRLTAAHHSLPLGSKVKVVNKDNGRSVIVTINDRTNEKTKRKRNYVIDLSRESAREIGIEGIGRVALYTSD